ncbi:GNAT family N-acetyltransferase [Kitasatospora camelliae]|uniref:GNAT family N-acetyltransferase n=1 Tax=Kitasatospora camelliae TaxID=3156397 RepID=A0AAU8K2E8_9ACTN
MSTRVTDRQDESRFEIFDGEQPAGFAEYYRSEGEIAFLHTEIDPAFGGRGLGAALIEAALGAAREEGLAVLPYCPFVRGWLLKHPDQVDLVPADQRAKFGL